MAFNPTWFSPFSPKKRIACSHESEISLLHVHQTVPRVHSKTNTNAKFLCTDKNVSTPRVLSNWSVVAVVVQRGRASYKRNIDSLRAKLLIGWVSLYSGTTEAVHNLDDNERFKNCRPNTYPAVDVRRWMNYSSVKYMVYPYKHQEGYRTELNNHRDTPWH